MCQLMEPISVFIRVTNLCRIGARAIAASSLVTSPLGLRFLSRRPAFVKSLKRSVPYPRLQRYTIAYHAQSPTVPFSLQSAFCTLHFAFFILHSAFSDFAEARSSLRRLAKGLRAVHSTGSPLSLGPGQLHPVVLLPHQSHVIPRRAFQLRVPQQGRRMIGHDQLSAVVPVHPPP